MVSLALVFWKKWKLILYYKLKVKDKRTKEHKSERQESITKLSSSIFKDN